jgi:hypothetical protein
MNTDQGGLTQTDELSGDVFHTGCGRTENSFAVRGIGSAIFQGTGWWADADTRKAAE